MGIWGSKSWAGMRFRGGIKVGGLRLGGQGGVGPWESGLRRLSPTDIQLNPTPKNPKTSSCPK